MLYILFPILFIVLYKVMGRVSNRIRYSSYLKDQRMYNQDQFMKMVSTSVNKIAESSVKDSGNNDNQIDYSASLSEAKGELDILKEKRRIREAMQNELGIDMSDD